MDLSRQEYPAMLASFQPAQAVAILNERIRHVGRLNNEIADWLLERRRIEEAYVLGLRKLAGKQPPDDTSELGVFSTPWQKIVGATESLAEAHHRLAQKIEIDAEQPLRSFLSANKEAQTMAHMSGNLASIAETLDSAQKKSDKLKDRGAKAATSKVAQAASELDNAQSQWDSQAPYVFEKLQEVDETRVNHLRDVLTQFQTHETDRVERNRLTTEQCLNSLLNVETVDEIRTFALRTASGQPRMERHRSRVPTSNTLAPPSSTANIDDGSSQRSGSTQDKTPSRFGLRRLGTVMGRRRQSFHPYGRTSSPERKSASNLGILSSLGSKARSRSKEPRHTSEPLQSSPPARLRSEAQSQESSRPSNAPSSPPVARESADKPNGAATELIEEVAGPSTAINGAPEIPTLMEPLQPVKSEPPAPDPEGFSVAPAAADPISQAEQEALAESSGPQFKVDIKNAPIHEEDADVETALANVANTLRAQAALPRKSGTIRGRRDVRNTVFIPSPEPPMADPITIAPEPAPLQFPPTTPPTQSTAVLPATTISHSPFKPGRHLSIDDIHGGSDTQSVRSGRSLSSSTSVIVKHPDMHEPGLNASFVETASAWFDQGVITKAVVIGELAMVFNPIDLSAPFGTETVRLDNFPVLEKVAPNPTFIDQIPDKAGAYTVNLSTITKTSVAFKYQVHIEENDFASHAPVLLSPAWKAEPLQTSVILSYSLNPLFAMAERPSITLRNLVLVLHLDGKASSCQSKPVGTFSREKSVLYWRLGDVTLAPDQPAQQLRARFFTEAEAKPGNAEARWEISGGDVAGLGSGLAVSQLSQRGPDGGGTAAATVGTSEYVDPFADEDSPIAAAPREQWKEVPTVKRIVSGTYQAV